MLNRTVVSFGGGYGNGRRTAAARCDGHITGSCEAERAGVCPPGASALASHFLSQIVCIDRTEAASKVITGCRAIAELPRAATIRGTACARSLAISRRDVMERICIRGRGCIKSRVYVSLTACRTELLRNDRQDPGKGRCSE